MLELLRQEVNPGMRGAVVVEDNEGNEAKCICHSCPSYPRGGEPVLFCARGESDRTVKRTTCTCPGCAVWNENDLSRQYYCNGEVE